MGSDFDAEVVSTPGLPGHGMSLSKVYGDEGELL
jgi:hypothetical protein